MKTSTHQNTGPAQRRRHAAFLVGDHRPGVEEQKFDVEHQEHDGDQVKLDVELHGRALPMGSMPDS